MSNSLGISLLLLACLVGSGFAGSSFVNGDFEEANFNGWGKSPDNISFSHEEPDHNIKSGFGGISPAEGTYFAWLWAHNSSGYTYIRREVFLDIGDIVSGMAAYGEPAGFEGIARVEIHEANTHNPDDTTLIAGLWMAEETTDWSNFQWQPADAGTYTLFLSVQRIAGNDLLTGEDIYSIFAVFDDVKVVLTATCHGDIDQDGVADGSDLFLLAADFGRTGCESDILGVWIGDEVGREPDTWSFSFINDQFHIAGYREWYRGTYIIDRSMSPSQIDFIINSSEDGSAAGKISLAIFKTEGSTLTIAANEPGAPTRPTSFEPAAGTRIFVLEE